MHVTSCACDKLFVCGKLVQTKFGSAVFFDNNMLRYITSHHITLHYITLHYITLHCITLHYITLHYITLHYITLHYITLHYITLHYITLHGSTLHYITITLHGRVRVRVTELVEPVLVL